MTDIDVDKPITIQLSRAEALVLFEWLTQVDAAGSLPMADPAEQEVMWRIEGQLEKTLLEPLAPNYREVVEAARREVRGSQG